MMRCFSRLEEDFTFTSFHATRFPLFTSCPLYTLLKAPLPSRVAYLRKLPCGERSMMSLSSSLGEDIGGVARSKVAW